MWTNCRQRPLRPSKFNIIFAAVLGIGTIEIYQVGGVLLIGALSYGTSLVLFIGALRKIGSSRSSTYFAIGPFIGVLSALVVLREEPPPFFWFATGNDMNIRTYTKLSHIATNTPMTKTNITVICITMQILWSHTTITMCMNG